MESLWLKSGIQGVASSAISLVGSFDGRVAGLCQVYAVGRDKSRVAAPPKKTAPSPSPSRFSFRYPLKSLWFGSSGAGDHGHGGITLTDTVLVEDGEESDGAEAGVSDDEETSSVVEGRNGNWIFNVLHLHTEKQEPERNCSNGELLEMTENNLLIDQHDDSGEDADYVDEEEEEEEEEWCDACRVDFDGEEEVEINKDTFSKFLQRVSLDQAKVYDKLAYLGNLAYAISDIKPEKLFKTHGLRMVTSSAEKKKLASKAAEEEQASLEVKADPELTKDASKDEEKKGSGFHISPFVAYQVAASAASYVHSHMKGILPLKSSEEEQSQDQLLEERVDPINSDMASFMAATDSVTSVVAAEEEVKQALADDLNSTYSSPCDWFICDDDESNTRFFVIQGSESLSSWQANLLFEPIQFEGFDILVHRGIYEAAKGIYKQMLPEVRTHLKNNGKYATFRFTGHSLGGSLSLLINLMLLIRGEVPAASLLPVITFGAPAVMCGGDRLLHKLGLPRSHVQSVTMHRDIVPRAFSCSYPSHVAELLKAINGNFRNHPCLNNEKLLYTPMGELLILQPDEKFSPGHHLLPSGSGLYLLTHLMSDSKKQLRAAQKLFLDSPHPLEILSDRSAYGSGGTIQRDHDMNSYSRCIQVVIRHELNRIRKASREHRRKQWWPLVGVNDGIVLDRSVHRRINLNQHRFNFSGIVGNGRESVKRFSRLVASQRLHLFMVLLLPARLLMLGVYSTVSFY